MSNCENKQIPQKTGLASYLVSKVRFVTTVAVGFFSRSSWSQLRRPIFAANNRKKTSGTQGSVRCHFVKFDIYFLGLSWEIFFGVITDWANYINLITSIALEKCNNWKEIYSFGSRIVSTQVSRVARFHIMEHKLVGRAKRSTTPPEVVNG